MAQPAPRARAQHVRMAFPKFGAFQVAVLGVVSPVPLGAARSCIECRAAGLSTGPCAGFGSGCLARPAPQPAPDSSSRRLDKA